MNEEYYPWGGDFTAFNPKGCIGIVLLNIEFIPDKTVAIYGKLKTENIGIEKIVANVISNPHIRYLLICGEDIRGHRSGSSLMALYKNGIDKQNRIINAPGAIPYIENLDNKALKRFQDQIEIINFIGKKDIKEIKEKIIEYIKKSPAPYGEPYIAIRIKPKTITTLDDKRVIHSKVIIDYMGKVKKRG
jgi:tetrahydromethanopterin S-methyltransferase subunit A